MTTEKLLYQGAESKIFLRENFVIKRRIKKSYRIPEIDEKLRKLRTRAESKIMEKLSSKINIPKIIKVDEKSKEIIMQYIEGKKLSDFLDNFPLSKQIEICKEIGKEVAKIHDSNIIHSDLTTSNMILADKTKETNKFKKQLSKLKKLNLPNNKYAVFGSGPLAIRGIRESKDIDIIVKSDLWLELTKKHSISKFISGPTRKRYIKMGGIEIYPDWLPWIENTEKLIEDCDIFDGIRFVKLKYVILWKKLFGREKDRRDIQLIEEYKQNFSIFFIDFGLSFHSTRVEDKAVDLHLLKQALESKHFQNWEKLFKAVLSEYNSKDKEKILKQLEKVEKRGRYK